MLQQLTMEHKPAMLALVAATAMFSEEEIAYIADSFDQSQGSAIWLGAFDQEQMVGVAYSVPAEMTHGTWNVLMLLVHPEQQRKGVGNALMQLMAKMLQQQKQRLLIVETSSTDAFQQARDFYTAIGYSQQGTVEHYYDNDDHKVTFSNKLS